MKTRVVTLFLIGIAAIASAGCGGGGESAEAEATTSTGAVPFDRAFIDGMVPHHRAAIEMAKAATGAGLTQSDLIEIARDIVVTQQREIDDMLDWREQWFGSRVVDPEGARSLGLSEEEMGMQHDADFSSVEDVDQAFATMMIDHHRGAVRMAELAREQGQHAEISELADRIIAAQEREIEVMEKHAAGVHHG